MTVRLDVRPATALDRDARVRLTLAIAALPETRRVAVSPDGRLATVYAGELSAERLHAALTEAGIDAEVRSGLAPEAEAALQAPPGERFRPIGR